MRSRRHSISISVRGRFQFSTENAYSVSAFRSHLRAGLDHGAHRTHPGLVPRHAQLAAALGPAPVAVHDDGDVRGQPSGIDRARQRVILLTRFKRLEKSLHPRN